MLFKTVSILAPGLLGASLMQAIKKASPETRLFSWARRPEIREACQKKSWCDSVFDSAQEAVKEADLVVICTPVASIIPLFKDIAPHCKTGCLITDVGSTKEHICHEAQKHGPSHVQFIGSHPMAGSEKSGLEHAQADLFTHAACFVTPQPDTPNSDIEKIVALWKKLDMRVTCTSPKEHDEIVAHISHLPHLIASSICQYLATTDKHWAQYAGHGLRDTTRVASGNRDMWMPILKENKNNILHAIHGFQKTSRP